MAVGKKSVGTGRTRIRKGKVELGSAAKVWNPSEWPLGDEVVFLGSTKNKKRVIDKLLDRIGMGGRRLISVGLGNNHDIQCETKPNKYSSSRGESEFYDLKSVSPHLPKAWSCLILALEDGVNGIHGILDHPEILARSGKIIILGVQDSSRHSAGLRVAEIVRGNIKLDTLPILKDQELVFAQIDPGPKVSNPKPLNYPSTKGILPHGMDIPPPKGVANDYSNIIQHEVDNQGEWRPALDISIIIPVYNRPKMLARTLWMITHQTYPLDLIEVVIADDGSNEDILSVVEKFRDKLTITYTNQEDQGYRLSAARNMGIRASSHDYIIILDADVAPTPSLVEAYARRFDCTSRVVLCGHRRYIDANSIDPQDISTSPSQMLSLPDIITQNEVFKKDGHVLDWRMGMYRSTANLRFEKFPFRAVCGGNIAFHRSVFDRAGDFDEEFRAWGKEDTEWGFRIWNKGEYIIPVYEACGLHQEPEGGRNETDRELGLEEVMPIFTDRVPVMYRKPEHGVQNSVPLVSIYIPAYNAEGTIVETVQSALDQTFEDLEVCVAVDGAEDGTMDKLEKHFFDNPRVRWVHQENQGIGGASNSAVQLCRGVFIGQLDSDDILLPEAVEIMVEKVQSDTRIGVAYGSFQKETPEGEFLEDGYDWPEFSREKLMYGCIVHHFRLFRARDWWRTVGFATDITNAIDYDIFLKLSSVTEMVHVPEWTYVYRIHAESTSIRQMEAQIRNHHVVINRHLKRTGLNSEWEALSESEENPRKVKFARRKYESPKKTAQPFSKLQASMREAAPPLIKKIARLEASKRPWTIHGFPKEQFIHRMRLYCTKRGLPISDEVLRSLQSKHGSNLWAVLEGIEEFEGASK